MDIYVQQQQVLCAYLHPYAYPNGEFSPCIIMCMYPDAYVYKWKSGNKFVPVKINEALS